MAIFSYVKVVRLRLKICRWLYLFAIKSFGSGKRCVDAKLTGRFGLGKRCVACCIHLQVVRFRQKVYRLLHSVRLRPVDLGKRYIDCCIQSRQCPSIRTKDVWIAEISHVEVLRLRQKGVDCCNQSRWGPSFRKKMSKMLLLIRFLRGFGRRYIDC